MSKLSTPLWGPLLVVLALLGGPAVVARSGETIVLREGPSPAFVEIAPGTTVTWRNGDSERHRVRSRGAPREFDSGDLEPGETFAVRFEIEGRYRYLDERREAGDDEREDDDAVYGGTIVVRGTSAGSSAIPAGPGPAATPVAAASATPTGPAGSAAPDGSVAMASPSAAARPSPVAVDIIDRAFLPPDVTVTVGQAVEWTNRDGEGHTVTALDSSDDSGLMAGGMTFSRTFETPGAFEYGCAIHPEMRGRVTVTTPPPPSPLGSSASTGAPVSHAPVSHAPVSPTPVSASDPLAAAEVQVAIVDVAYQPATVEVAAGTIVRWTNDDPVVHTVNARDGSFSSGVMRPGAEFSLAFETPGTYPYFCAIHPQQVGTIVVSAPGG